MTEMIVKAISAMHRGPRYAIDPVAFFKALFLAPLIVAGLGFWALLIPVFAVLFGYPAYLAIGTPVLLIYLYYRSGTPSEIAWLALACVALPLLIVGGGSLAYEAFAGRSTGNLGGLLGFGLMAMVHAVIWGAVFGGLYNRWRSQASRHPIPDFPKFSAQKEYTPC